MMKVGPRLMRDCRSSRASCLTSASFSVSIPPRVNATSSAYAETDAMILARREATAADCAMVVGRRMSGL